MRSLFSICIGLALTNVLWGQIEPGWIPRKSYVEAAQKAVDEKNYYSALNYYLEALEYDSTDVQVLYDAAETAREFNSFNLAEQFYSRTIERDTSDRYFKASFWRAAMLQHQGKYEEAIDQYNLYITQYDDKDTYLTSRAQKEVSACRWAQGIMGKPVENIDIIRESDRINSPDSEFGGVLESDGLTFSALKNYDDNEGIPLKPYSRIYSVTGDQLPIDYGTDLNKRDAHTAHTAYNINRSRMYYTVCDYLNGTDIRCDIYYRMIRADGSLGEEMMLDSTINKAGFTATQPNIGFDNYLGKEVLYFVSDRPGPDPGRRDLNIWYATIESGDSYGQPVFLAELNTPEDDITPFYHSNSQVLYFSSQGYTSLGGFDIYRAAKDKSGQWAKPENLGVPVNSSYDEIYYYLNKEGDLGLMSSNRDSSAYVTISLKSDYLVEESESCCYDIYRVNIGDLAVRLIAMTYDSKSLDSLSGVTIRLVDPVSGLLISEMTNDLGHEHFFDLERSKSYMVISSKPGYKTDTMMLNTNSIFKSGDIIRRIYLQKSSLDLQALTFDAVSRSPLPGVTVTVKDLTDTSIQEVTLINEVGNDYDFELIPGHRYQLTGSKERYYDDVQEFTANDEDGTGLIIKRLFLDRRDLNIYLPLAVYFDNDLPDRRTLSLNTTMTYTQTFDEYVVKKQEFKDNYANGLRGAARDRALQEIDQFFMEFVNRGYDQLQLFLGAMHEQLKQGKEFELSIRGYASPRADSRYNLALGQRRVKAMRNEINDFDGGVLIPYIDNEQLKITELSYGENLVPPGVVDSYNDRKNSIYSPSASKERRAEIVEIKSQNSDNN